MPTWNDALEKVQQLSDRCDAFFNRRADRAAKRDLDDPLSSPGKPVYFREDTHLASERNELRTGALSKADIKE